MSTQTQEQNQVQEDVQNTTNSSEENVRPIFDEIEEMNPGAAVNVLIQASQMAQASGALTTRDSVMLAKAISVLRPGTI